MGFGAPAPSLIVVVLDGYAGSCKGTDLWRYQSRRRRTDSAVGRHGGCSSSFVPSLPTLPGDRPHRVRHLSRGPLREV